MKGCALQLSASLTDGKSSRAEMHMNESLNRLVAWAEESQLTKEQVCQFAALRAVVWSTAWLRSPVSKHGRCGAGIL